VAATQEHTDNIELLISHGAKIEARDQNGKPLGIPLPQSDHATINLMDQVVPEVEVVTERIHFHGSPGGEPRHRRRHPPPPFDVLVHEEVATDDSFTPAEPMRVAAHG